jgi:PAS domain S-box-containing protein
MQEADFPPKLKEIYFENQLADLVFALVIGLSIFLILWAYGKPVNDAKNQYKNLYEHNPIPMWIYEISSLRFVSVNQAAMDHYGYSLEEFLGMHIIDIKPAEEIPQILQYLNNYEKGVNRSSLWTHTKKNGEIIYVEIMAIDVDFRKKACRLVSATDVTEKRKKEQEIIKLSLVAENATNSIMITDSKRRVEWVNQAFTELTGYTQDEVEGKMPKEFLMGPGSDMNLPAQIQQNSEQNKAFSGVTMEYRKDGNVFWARVTVSPVIREGIIVNFVIIHTDITTIKQQNQNLRDIAFTASHGFRKPLANILGLVSVLSYADPHKKEIDLLKESANELDEELKRMIEKTNEFT